MVSHKPYSLKLRLFCLLEGLQTRVLSAWSALAKRHSRMSGTIRHSGTTRINTGDFSCRFVPLCRMLFLPAFESHGLEDTPGVNKVLLFQLSKIQPWHPPGRSCGKAWRASQCTGQPQTQNYYSNCFVEIKENAMKIRGEKRK